MRCFLAVPVPDDVRQAVESLLCRMRPRMHAARFVSPEALHLTLHFFADLSPDQVQGARAAAREACAAAAAFDVSLEGLGVFPDLRRPKVLWIDVGEGRDGLAGLQASIAAGLRGRGLPLDERPYRAHLTLARLPGPEPALAELLSPGGEPSFPAFRVQGVVLFESVLRPSGAVHTIVDRFAFSG